MLTPARRRVAALSIALVALAIVLAGCGSSVDPALVQSAGTQGTILQTNYALLSKNILDDASTRDLKDVNAAIKAGDPKKATPGDLRRAQGEIEHRINVIAAYRKSIAVANRKLRKAPAPDFEKYLDSSAQVKSFSSDYAKTTAIAKRTGALATTATVLASNALEKYLDFLEQWEEYVANGDTSGFQSSADASDAAVAKLNRRKAALEREGRISARVGTLVDQMAEAASGDSQLSSLIDDLKDQYPKSFLAVHIVEK